MPIELPNLDDRTYDDLVQEALSMIPTYAPEWTNHNPSDPGIMLIELFASITEMLLYRLNRLTNANKLAFLNLIASDGTRNKKFPEPLDEVALNTEIRKAVAQLRQSDRAVTTEDYENFDEKFSFQASDQIARVRCLSRRNTKQRIYNNVVLRPGNINLVVVPNFSREQLFKEPIQFSEITFTQEFMDSVKIFLENKKLLTTKIKIYQPTYVCIKVHLQIYLKPDFIEQNVRPNVEKALEDFLDPLRWEFGRHVYLSEIYQLLEKIAGIDYIEPIPNQAELSVDKILAGEKPEIETDINKLNDRLLKIDKSQLIGVEIYQDELAVWSSSQSRLEFKSKALGVIESN